SPKMLAANTAGTLHGTRLIPTVPAASTQRDRFLVSMFIDLYLPTNVRAGKIIARNWAPLAKATTKVEKMVVLISDPADFTLSIIFCVKTLNAPVSSKTPPSAVAIIRSASVPSMDNNPPRFSNESTSSTSAGLSKPSGVTWTVAVLVVPWTKKAINGPSILTVINVGIAGARLIIKKMVNTGMPSNNGWMINKSLKPD